MISVSLRRVPPTSMKTIWRPSPCLLIQSAASTPDTSMFADTMSVPFGTCLAGVVKLILLGTHDMVADALTKSLPTPALVRWPIITL
jgi:hypothetical protein